MNKNIQNIKLVTEILKEQNINYIVISPGGTNIELVKKIQEDPFFNCYSIVDERSAMYFAIGIYLQTGKEVATICTSAQATRNYIPGLTEAFYKRVPILAITMEKHPRFKYQEYMQAPDQTSLPKDCVKKSIELPYVQDINDIYQSKRLINEAILELNHNGKGPVQLCIPWLDFEKEDIYPSRLAIKRLSVEQISNVDLSNKKILIVIGEHRPFGVEMQKAIDYFCENTNSVIYTNLLSNFSNEYSINGNLILSTITDLEFDQLQPNILITIGGQTGDYPFYLRFSKNKYSDIEVWRISEDGNVVDTYDKLSVVFQGNAETFFKSIKKQKVSHDYLELWKEKNKELSTDVEVPFSNLSIAKFLHNKIPDNSIIQFSILNSLRVWELFNLNDKIECYSNVGAFGIDGGMSTLIGQSVTTEKLSFMIIGDLAFFYDMNSLGIRHIKNNLRIILINNNGGVEFKLHGEDKEEFNKYISAADHFKTARGWAEDCGFRYLNAYSMSEFIEKSKVLLEKSDKPVLIEVFISDEDEKIAYQKIININKKESLEHIVKSKTKDSIKKIIGTNNYKKIKRIIKK